MLNQYAVDNHTLPVNQCFFPPHPDPGGMLSRSLGMPSRNNGPPSIWDTHGLSGNVFAKPTASSSAPYPQESNPWISNVSEHTSPYVMNESQTPLTELMHGEMCQLVVVALETGGRWSAEAVDFIYQVAGSRAREAPPLLRGSAFYAWHRRWKRLLSVSCARAFASSLVCSRSATPEV